MLSQKKREQIIARLIANTHRRKRTRNLFDIARDIKTLENDFGNLKEVTKILNISSEMLRKILSVLQLAPNVQKLFKSRRIDVVNVAYFMKDFSSKDQKIIADSIIADRLTGDDLKVLAPLHRAQPNLSIKQLISRIIDSKDTKIYVAYFLIPENLHGAKKIPRQLKQILPAKEIVSLKIEKGYGILKLTPIGYKQLRKNAKDNNVSLRKYIDNILNKRLLE